MSQRHIFVYMEQSKQQYVTSQFVFCLQWFRGLSFFSCRCQLGVPPIGHSLEVKSPLYPNMTLLNQQRQRSILPLAALTHLGLGCPREMQAVYNDVDVVVGRQDLVDGKKHTPIPTKLIRGNMKASALSCCVVTKAVNLWGLLMEIFLLTAPLILLVAASCQKIRVTDTTWVFHSFFTDDEKKKLVCDRWIESLVTSVQLLHCVQIILLL